MKKTGKAREKGYEDKRIHAIINVPGRLLELFDVYAYKHGWTRSSLLEGMMWGELMNESEEENIITSENK